MELFLHNLTLLLSTLYLQDCDKEIVIKHCGKSDEIIPDEKEMIKEKLRYLSDELGVNLLLTSGGTGFSARDITPEATIEVIEKAVTGIPEAIRYYGMQKTAQAMLSRGVAGIRKNTLIINLPGSVKAVRESLEAILPALSHGLDILCGTAADCGQQ